MNDRIMSDPPYTALSPRAFECLARRRGSACAWPDCGCDEHATKVIRSLVEQGWQPASLPRPQSAERDPEKLYCLDCGLPYADPAFADFVVSDETWQAICPEPGVLCVTCMTRRAVATGVEAKGSFTGGPFANHDWRKPQPGAEQVGRVARAIDEATIYETRRNKGQPEPYEVFYHSDPDVVRPVVVATYSTQHAATNAAEKLSSEARARAAITALRPAQNAAPSAWLVRGAEAHRPFRDKDVDRSTVLTEAEKYAGNWGKVTPLYEHPRPTQDVEAALREALSELNEYADTWEQTPIGLGAYEACSRVRTRLHHALALLSAAAGTGEGK